MRTRTIAIVFAASISLGFIPFAGAAAQTTNAPATVQAPAPASTTGSAAQTPVGHRQPTQSSVPASVQKQETTGSGAIDPFGAMPKICNNC